MGNPQSSNLCWSNFPCVPPRHPSGQLKNKCVLIGQKQTAFPLFLMFSLGMSQNHQCPWKPQRFIIMYHDLFSCSPFFNGYKLGVSPSSRQSHTKFTHHTSQHVFFCPAILSQSAASKVGFDVATLHCEGPQLAESCAELLDMDQT